MFERSDKEIRYLQMKLGDFYTTDSSVLNTLKEEWIFHTPGGKYACGYHYFLYLCKNGVVIESFGINLDCKEIASDQGYFYFKQEQPEILAGKVNRAYEKNYDFGTVTEAREFRERITHDTMLLMTEKPEWEVYDGRFRFTYNCAEGTRICLEKEDSLIKSIETRISTAYPEEVFELSERGGSLNSIIIEVKCNRSLSDKFNLYKRDPYTYQGKWLAYKLSLTAFWKSDIE